MAGLKSRWADNEDDAALEAQRKQEKEEKKRAKALKQRKLDDATALKAAQDLEETTKALDAATSPTQSQRPSKRRKLSSEPELEAAVNKDDVAKVKLLRFPGPEWKSCRSVENYEKLNDIEEGAYGWVSRAKDTATGKVVALKRLKMDNVGDGVPITGLREIQTLMDCDHPNIVGLREVVLGEDKTKFDM
jgi:cell division cycle 2-like protein